MRTLTCCVCRQSMRFLGRQQMNGEAGYQGCDYWECRGCRRTEGVLLRGGELAAITEQRRRDNAEGAD